MSSNSFLGGYSYNPGNVTSKGNLGGAINNQLGNNAALQSSTNAQRSTESGTLIPGYQGLVTGGGYTPQQQASITQGTLGGIQGSYGSAARQATNTAAATHNSAGLNSFMGGLARSKAQDLGQAGLQLQSSFANQALQQKMAGLQGLSSLYGVDTNFLNSLNNTQNNLLNIGNSVQSRSKGVLGTIGSVLNL